MSTLRTLQLPYTVFCVAFLPARGAAPGQRQPEALAVTGARGAVTLVDVAAPGRLPRTAPVGFGYREPLLVVAAAPDGRSVVAAGNAQASERGRERGMAWHTLGP
eukprot:11091-Chlamydomonas_euryale.AAC.1